MLTNTNVVANNPKLTIQQYAKTKATTIFSSVVSVGIEYVYITYTVCDALLRLMKCSCTVFVWWDGTLGHIVQNCV